METKRLVKKLCKFGEFANDDLCPVTVFETIDRQVEFDEKANVWAYVPTRPRLEIELLSPNGPVCFAGTESEVESLIAWIEDGSNIFWGPHLPNGMQKTTIRSKALKRGKPKRDRDVI